MPTKPKDTPPPSNEGSDDNNTAVIKNGEDVKKLLEKVRAEEKKKLYPQIDHFKKQVEQSTAEKEAMAARLKELEEAQKKHAESKLTKDEQFQKQMEELRQQNIALQEQQKALVEESKRQIEEQRLHAYRAQALAEAGGEIIPELVFGNTEAEIDAAIYASRQRYAEIKSNVKQALKTSNSQRPVPGIGGAPPPEATKPSESEMTAEMIRDMTPEQWAKERLNIRKSVDGQMKQFFGRK